MTNAVFFKNHYGSPISLLKTFEKAGIQCETIHTFEEGVLDNFDPYAHDLAIFLGGPQGAHQVADYPYVAKTLEIIKARHAANFPSLAICLGAQEMAVALGGESIKGQDGNFSETGWFKLDVTPEGRRTAVRHFDAACNTRVLESHDDSFTLPQGAVLLASTERCPNQAFSLGASLALQFHPEVTKNGLSNLEGMVAKAVGNGVIDLAKLRADNALHIAAAERQTEKFALEWVAENASAAVQARQALTPRI